MNSKISGQADPEVTIGLFGETEEQKSRKKTDAIGDFGEVALPLAAAGIEIGDFGETQQAGSGETDIAIGDFGEVETRAVLKGAQMGDFGDQQD